jgi:hypothetical protein
VGSLLAAGPTSAPAAAPRQAEPAAAAAA